MFCIFLNVRYSNPKLMHIGHQYVAANFDPTVINGLLEMKAYHISPDKGVGIFTFKSRRSNDLVGTAPKYSALNDE